MKKLFLLLAVCGMMVSCGGEQKKKEETKQAGEQKTEQTDEQKTEQTGEQETEKSIKEMTLTELYDGMYEAMQSNDMDRFIKLARRADAIQSNLTPAEEAELTNYARSNFDKFDAVTEVMSNTNYEVMDEESDEEETEQLTIAQLFDTMYDALQSGNMERFIELAIITDEWGDELTPEQEKELEAYFQKSPEKLMAVMEAIENIDFDEYIDEIAYPENGYEEDYGYAVEDCGCAVEDYGYADEDYGYDDEDYDYDDECYDEEW